LPVRGLACSNQTKALCGSVPNFRWNGYEFYDAPKNGGTTIRLWLKLAEGGLPEAFDATGYYSLAGLGRPQAWMDTVMSHSPFFAPGLSGSHRWCIVRDPLERFISAYTDKILREQLAAWSVDQCIEMLASGEMLQLARHAASRPQRRAACHLLAQSTWFGSSRRYFHTVFQLSSMHLVKAFCEEHVFQMALPAFHARNQSCTPIHRISLTQSQADRLSDVYQSDYDAGWC
jgi:hypothetical protein